MKLLSTSAFIVFVIQNQCNGEQIIDSLQNGSMQCSFDGPYTHNNSHEHYSTKTSYFSVQNEDTKEIQIEGRYCMLY